MPINGLVKAKEEIIGVTVKNPAKENLGEICEIVLEKTSGQVAYAVLDCGSFLGIGGKLFALPWRALHFNENEKCFILNIDKETLKTAPGFDKNHWPTIADKKWTEILASTDEKSYME